MELFESIYYDLLLEGKSPEEILKILKHKFRDIPESIIDIVFKIDPTKKKTYTQWVLTLYKEERHVVDNAIRNGTLKKLFEYFQKTPDSQPQRFETLEDALYVVSNIDLLEKDSEDARANDFDIVYKSPEWVIAVPNTYQASHKLGENTDWCTAGYKFQDGEGYYNNYLNRYGGKYFINFDFRENEHLRGIDYPFKRYQYHFESNQFMDSHDDPVNFHEINMPEQVVEYYEENGYSFDKMDIEERMERYNEERWNDGICISRTRGLYILQEYDHENYEMAQPNMAKYMLYDVNYDDYDPISYDAIQKEPLYVDDTHDIYILNGKYGDTTDYGGNLTLYDGTDNCSPKIVIFDGNGRPELTDAKYYKVIEEYGYVFVAYLTVTTPYDYDNKVKTTKTFFSIEGNGFYCEVLIPFNSNDISNIEINHDVGGIYNSYESEFVIEIIWENGFHTLINVENHTNAEIIVLHDKPANNAELFTVNEENMILGTLRNYDGDDLSYQTNKNEISHYVLDLFYEDLFIVEMCDKKFNVFNSKTKQLIFPENFDVFKVNEVNRLYVQQTGYIIGKKVKSNGFALWSLNDGKQISKEYTLIDVSPNFNFFAGCVGDYKTHHEAYIINSDLNVYGPYYGMSPAPRCNNQIFVIERDKNGLKGEQKLLNLDTGKYEFDYLSKLTKMEFGGNLPILVGLNENNECLMYNYQTKELIDRDIMINYRPRLIRKTGFEDYICVRHSTTGKINLVNYINGNKLFQTDVNEIEDGCSEYSDIRKTVDGCLAYKINNTEFILNKEGDNIKILPTPNGITTGSTSNVFKYKTHGFQNPCISFTIHDENQPEIEVVYNYKGNNEAFVYDERGMVKLLRLCDTNIQQRVMSVLNPQKAQFVSQYNEMLNRMKNLIW